MLSDGESVSHPEFRLQVVLTPGHVSNHACLLLEDEGLLFTGDHLMQGTTVVIIPPEGSMRDYLASLRRLQHMPVTSLAPGHGAVIPDAQAEIARVIAHRLAREAKVVAALSARAVRRSMIWCRSCTTTSRCRSTAGRATRCWRTRSSWWRRGARR